MGKGGDTRPKPGQTCCQHGPSQPIKPSCSMLFPLLGPMVAPKSSQCTLPARSITVVVWFTGTVWTACLSWHSVIFLPSSPINFTCLLVVFPWSHCGSNVKCYPSGHFPPRNTLLTHCYNLQMLFGAHSWSTGHLFW